MRENEGVNLSLVNLNIKKLPLVINSVSSNHNGTTTSLSSA